MDSQASVNTSFNRLNFQGAFHRAESNDSIESQESQIDLPRTNINPTSKRSANRRLTLYENFGSTSSSNKIRKDDSTSSAGEYKDLFSENLLKQSQNHQLHHEVLQLQKDKMQVELDRAKLDLETARTLADIEIKKRTQLAELEVKKKQMELNK